MGEAACRRPRERHSPGPNLALNGLAPRAARRCTPPAADGNSTVVGLYRFAANQGPDLQNILRFIVRLS